MLQYQKVLEIGLAPDAEALQARLIEAAAALGFGLSSATHIRGRLSSGKATVHAVFNTPPEFLADSRSADLGQQDPFLASVLAAPGCHAYDEAFYRRAGADDLWGLISAHGYRHGMAVALHEASHAEVFSFGVDGPDALPAQIASRLALEAQLRLVAMHAHEAAKRLWTKAQAPDLNSITAEEATALKWASDGMCVWVQGDKLVHSRPGLVGAQRSAARKLGASGPGAVLRAIEGGLISR